MKRDKSLVLIKDCHYRYSHAFQRNKIFFILPLIKRGVAAAMHTTVACGQRSDSEVPLHWPYHLEHTHSSEATLLSLHLPHILFQWSQNETKAEDVFQEHT